jgi:tetratricopeptide (TPR) repeat protein
MGRAEEAQATLDKAIAIAEEAGAFDVLMSATNNAMVGFFMKGKWDRAESYQRRSVAASERVGDPGNLAFALRGLSAIVARRGGWREARELAERGKRVSDAVGDSWGRPYVLLVLAAQNVFEGRWDEATLQLDEAWESSARRDDLSAMSLICWVQAWLSLLQGHPEQVPERAQPLLDNPKLELLYRLSLRERVAHARIELGDVSSAETLARQVVQSAYEEGLDLVRAEALPTLGSALARLGRSAEAQEAFEQAIELSRPMPYPFNEALARYDWGRMLADDGDAAGAREQLDVALTIFRQLGARPFIERSERALASLQLSEEPT